jgi:hypothetical protein
MECRDSLPQLRLHTPYDVRMPQSMYQIYLAVRRIAVRFCHRPGGEKFHDANIAVRVQRVLYEIDAAVETAFGTDKDGLDILAIPPGLADFEPICHTSFRELRVHSSHDD